MPSFCIIPSCVGKYSHTADISFHKFPHKDSALVQKWIDFVVQERGSEWKPSRWSSICSRHFDQTDYRQHCGRRCLKPQAVPSQLTPREDVAVDDPPKQSCLLCGEQTGKSACAKGGSEVSEWIAKCFPAISFEKSHREISPCDDCVTRLKTFAAFVDTVTQYQRDKLKIPQDKMSQERQKGVKIKQEVMVKEEMNPQVANELREAFSEPHFEEVPTQATDKTSCDQYLDEIFNCVQPDEVENCEIMEISDLEKVFIDIAEETSDTEVKIPPKNRIEIISSISVKSELKPEGWITDLAPIPAFPLHVDHSYAKSPFSIDNRCKMEKLDGNPAEKTSTSTPRINIIKNLVLPHRCDKCPAHFDTLTALSDHKIGHHAPWKKPSCVICGEFFDTVKDCLAHRFKLHHKIAERKLLNRRAKCRNCGQYFPSELVHNHHQRFLCERRKEPTFPCPKCQQEFPKLLELRKHTLENHPEIFHNRRVPKIRDDGHFRCDACDRNFGTKANLQRHQRQHRPKALWDKKCDDCGQIFDKIRDLRRHVNASPRCSHFQPNLKAAETENLLQFMCSVCGRQFSTPNGLKLHENSHQAQTTKPSSCEICGKKFQRSNLLWQHRISHTEARKFVCRLCPKVFKRANGLHQHIQGFHLKLRPHVCAVCNRGYALKGDMKRCRHSWLKME